MADRLNRRAFGLGAAATGALVMTGGLRRAHAQVPPLKLGVLAPRSGFEALLGQGCHRGFEVAVPLLRDMGNSS
jgi:branched-chain amino acid transport system substrate-binding protein